MSGRGRYVRLPAEWEPQAGVMLTWPHDATDWRPRLPRVLPVFAAIGAAISRFQSLLSVCASAAQLRDVEHRLLERGARRERLLFAVAASDDSWARDHGPLTVLDGDEAVLNDYRFNGWGGKFPARQDTAITARLHRLGVFGDAERVDTGLVVEGGAIETDGEGTLLATSHSLINDSRNPGLSRSAIEQRLGEQLGIRHFLWLEHGRISGDDTDAHIDTLARFTDPATIVHASAAPGDDDDVELRAMSAELRALRRADGQAYRLLALPFPGVHRDADGRRLPATYANFLIINGAVLMPAYGVPQDDEARAVLRDAFPDRDVIAIDCSEIIRQHGSLHCLTMQLPAAVSLHDARGIGAA